MSTENDRNKKQANWRRVRLWIFACLSALFTIAPFIFKSQHWPGGNLMVILIPIPVAILLMCINKLFSSDNYLPDSNDTECALRVDYRVRYSINRAMKMKQWQAWAMIALAGISIVLYAVMKCVGYGDFLVETLLGIIGFSIVLFTTGILTLKASKRLEASLKMNNQEEFGLALKKYKRQRTLILWCLLIIFTIITAIIISAINA